MRVQCHLLANSNIEYFNTTLPSYTNAVHWHFGFTIQSHNMRHTNWYFTKSTFCHAMTCQIFSHKVSPPKLHQILIYLCRRHFYNKIIQSRIDVISWKLFEWFSFHLVWQYSSWCINDLQVDLLWLHWPGRKRFSHIILSKGNCGYHATNECLKWCIESKELVLIPE